jgi:hypothetical protein
MGARELKTNRVCAFPTKMREEKIMAERSKPGEGEVVRLFNVGRTAESSEEEPLSKTNIQISSSVDEDFAVCKWSVTVKAKISVSQADLVLYLQALAGSVKRGFIMSPENVESAKKRIAAARERKEKAEFIQTVLREIGLIVETSALVGAMARVELQNDLLAEQPKKQNILRVVDDDPNME